MSTRRNSVRLIALVAASAVILANATIPKADRPGSKDHPLLKRYQGSFIVAYEHKAFAEFVLPTSPLVPVPDRTTRQNNRVHEPKTSKACQTLAHTCRC